MKTINRFGGLRHVRDHLLLSLMTERSKHAVRTLIELDVEQAAHCDDVYAPVARAQCHLCSVNNLEEDA